MPVYPDQVPGYDPSVINYPIAEIADSFNPRYGEQSEPVPVPGDAGPSRSMNPNNPVAGKKKRGLLGSIGHILGQVFAPDPGTLYGAAMNNPNGIWGARGAQEAYRRQQAADDISLETANAKLKRMQQQGEYTVAGNNVVHTRPDGTVEFITPPHTPTEKEVLLEKWRAMDEGDPAKQLIEVMLQGGNEADVLAAKAAAAAEAARIRAGATIGSARIRASSSGNKGGGRGGVKLPAGAVIIE